MRKHSSSLPICGGIWQGEVTLPPASDPHFNLQHTNTHHARGEREDREKTDLPPCSVLSAEASQNVLSLLRVEESSYAWDFYFREEVRHADGSNQRR